MSEDGKILVVGTTPDYVDWIRRVRPAGAVFLTEPKLRERALEPSPDPEEEILCELGDFDRVEQALRAHLRRRGISLVGLVCYDCETLELAAFLARRLSLPYPSPDSVRACRDKHLTKKLWSAAGVPCPDFRLVRDEEEAAAFLAEIRSPVVLKPLSGSGSEMVFRADNPEDCARAFARYRRGSARIEVLAEALVPGEEYSCDFLVGPEGARVLRVTRKYPRPGEPFGTIEAYELTPDLPGDLAAAKLEPLLGSAAAALGVDRGICMLDFICAQGKPFLLELAPRPGGACLPLLLRTAVGLDTIPLALDLARGDKAPARPEIRESAVGLGIYARRAGRLARLGAEKLLAAPRVLAVDLIRPRGTVIRLPPEAYDTWLLGYVVYRPDPARPVPKQNREMENLLEAEIAG